MQKFEKRAQKLGTGVVSDDKKVEQLKKAVDDLRKTLASTRKAVRDAEERAESAMERSRLLQHELDELERGPVEQTNTTEAAVDETPPEPAPEPVAEAKPDEVAEATKEKEPDHEKERMVQDIEHLRTKLSQTEKKVRSLRYDLGNTRRKAEHERRAYILTQGQLDLTQDLLYALEQSTGMKADDSRVAMSGRAKKRREIKQARAERRTKQEQMPERSNEEETQAPHIPEPVEEAAAPNGG